MEINFNELRDWSDGARRALDIEPDWLMTWEQSDTQLTLLFLQTGTHSDLF